jgi:fatty acid desaturase
MAGSDEPALRRFQYRRHIKAVKEASMKQTLTRNQAPVLDDTARARIIREGIRNRSRELRERLPFLTRHQSAIGLALQIVALAGMTGSAVAYATGALSAWAVIPLAAFFASIAHEVEHDLIHKCYFPTRARVIDALLAGGWLMRPSTVSPWIRRKLHLLHHKVSGTMADIEEQAVTNGMPMGPRRLLVMTDGLLCGILFRPVPPGTRGAVAKRIALAYFPLGFVYVALLYTWLGFHAAQLGAAAFGGALPQPAWMGAVDFLFVVWVAPNLLRTISLHLITSNLHYFGDVEEGNVLEQTQVLNPWFLLPLQLFCMNFGSTHGIHHFYVPDPFYVRQMSAAAAHRVMRENGVRFNDLGSFARANRYANS